MQKLLNGFGNCESLFTTTDIRINVRFTKNKQFFLRSTIVDVLRLAKD